MPRMKNENEMRGGFANGHTTQLDRDDGRSMKETKRNAFFVLCWCWHTVYVET